MLDTKHQQSDQLHFLVPLGYCTTDVVGTCTSLTLPKAEAIKHLLGMVKFEPSLFQDLLQLQLQLQPL